MSDTLSADQELAMSGAITSANGYHRLTYQSDGNLVLYKDFPGQPPRPLWASDTDGTPVGRCVLQSDGNLVLYRDAAGPRPTYQWDTETAERPAGRVLMQHDGNLVVYDPDGSPLWASGTDGHPGASLAIQDDGNLVVYDGGGATPLWASDTPRITRRAAVPGLDGWVEMTLRPSGLVRVSGHLHNDAVTGYRYRLRAIASNATVPVAAQRTGYVGGDVSTASRDEDWVEEYESPMVALHYAGFEADPPRLDVFAEHTGVVTAVLEDVLDLAISLAIGETIGLVILVGVELASLIGTGSFTAGSTLLGGNLLMLGPAGAVFVLLSAGVAALGTERRTLTEQEYAVADEVFAGTLPPRGDLLLTDAVGAEDRPFTWPRFDGKVMVNLGPAAYADPLAHRGLLIHELTHAWQIENHPSGAAWVADALVTQLGHSLSGEGYEPGPAGPPWEEFNLEQQATIVERWFTAGRRHTDPYYRYIEGNVRLGST